MIRMILIFLIVGGTSSFGAAQSVIDTVDVSFSLTTSMIFEYPVVNVDRGSRDLIAQKATEVENILQLKAGRRDLSETNLTVITADGSLHHFYVRYSDHPKTQVYRISEGLVEARFEGSRTDIEYEIATDRIVSHHASGVIAKHKGFRITFAVRGIYVHDDMLFLRIFLRNKSNIKYDIQSLRLFVRDKKKLKRTSSQEVELHPLYVRNKTKSINGNGSADVVFVFEKFTIPDSKTLDMELFELNGGRNLKVHIGNHAIVKAERLPIN
jgi:conjugative transposon TraN protein